MYLVSPALSGRFFTTCATWDRSPLLPNFRVLTAVGAAATALWMFYYFIVINVRKLVWSKKSGADVVCVFFIPTAHVPLHYRVCQMSLQSFLRDTATSQKEAKELVLDLASKGPTYSIPKTMAPFPACLVSCTGSRSFQWGSNGGIWIPGHLS